MTLASLIVTLIFVGVVLYIVNLIPMEGTLKQIINVLVILAVVIWVCESLGLFTGFGHPIRLR